MYTAGRRKRDSVSRSSRTPSFPREPRSEGTQPRRSLGRAQSPGSVFTPSGLDDRTGVLAPGPKRD